MASSIMMASLYSTLLLGLIIFQVTGQKQAPVQQTKQGPEQVPVTQLRQCGCDELDQCINEQKTQQYDLDSKCRQECGITFLSNDTAPKVSQCYESYEHSKKDKKSNKHQCVENLIGRSCLSSKEQEPSQQLTLTVNPSKIALKNPEKRHYKMPYPSYLNLYNACVKTCRKNHGVVTFGADGTPVKAGTKAAKVGNGYTYCATKLNCQLPQHDRKLQKQAKEICKYQQAPVEDLTLNLCTCLETALNQTFQCVPTYAPNTCSSEQGQSGERIGTCGDGSK